ncbi:Coiled-coil domain-containing protein 25 [Coemansia thaxteri]|uniref:Coiled-coil domain-containing protein 25 n=1 Tax=Coemansia thaxteri TaxID=2663907 RepID=A0A9W8BED9_9FUNG|nr:Coiled-coil domain-containing protein 25 [Coemansia thaxteri]KAJ2002593.1 Coiled-coil domain-containing protein 25 [Coemansia thaxteri]KAJ2465337.1 Coiled-coil domain-containing protein 25 [Coemansia sp. RSA 2322]KAJ2484843.1 Coiled-coil domain-containing protein 25 [Coemansia sp. RSA 2320]
MVLYFTSSVVDPPATIYMGKDKFENEDLIKHGWPEDVWFHVDKLSSAHVYLRLAAGQTWDTIDKALLDDLAQLCKANSIEGNKKDNIAIIYTPWSNLLKRGDMAPGQVSYKNPKLVKRVHVVQRLNEVVNRLNKTKKILFPDLYQQRAERDRDEKRERTMAASKKKAADLKAAEELRKAKEDNGYERVFAEVAAKNAKSKKKSTRDPTDIFGCSDDDDANSDAEGRHGGDFDDFF